MTPSGTIESKTMAFQRILQALKSVSTKDNPVYWTVHWHMDKVIFEMEITLSDIRTKYLMTRIIDLLAIHKAFHQCSMRVRANYEKNHIHITILKY